MWQKLAQGAKAKRQKAKWCKKGLGVRIKSR